MDYYVNKIAQPNGDHEVHKDGCIKMPSNRKYLGNYTNCFEAVRAAKEDYPTANGCWICSRECHTR